MNATSVIGAPELDHRSDNGIEEVVRALGSSSSSCLRRNATISATAAVRTVVVESVKSAVRLGAG